MHAMRLANVSLKCTVPHQFLVCYLDAHKSLRASGSWGVVLDAFKLCLQFRKPGVFMHDTIDVSTKTSWCNRDHVGVCQVCSEGTWSVVMLWKTSGQPNAIYAVDSKALLGGTGGDAVGNAGFSRKIGIGRCLCCVIGISGVLRYMYHFAALLPLKGFGVIEQTRQELLSGSDIALTWVMEPE